jgi:hypothetical protein
MFQMRQRLGWSRRLLIGASICGAFIAAFAANGIGQSDEGDATALGADLSPNAVSLSAGPGRILAAIEDRTGKSMPRTVIACFHERSRRFSAEEHPRRCHLRGHHEQRVVGISVVGMKWGLWGGRHTRAAYGVDTRKELAVRVIVFRPIACNDQIRWYSRVVIFYPGNSAGFEFDSPVCEGAPGSALAQGSRRSGLDQNERLINQSPRLAGPSHGLPPKVRPGPPISTYPGEVALTAFINPRGSLTRFRFQYGRTKAYGTITEASEEVLNGNHWIEIAESLCCKRLRPKTTFHYRVIAFNRYGSVHGQDRTFRTTRPASMGTAANGA